jgi:sugar lactone lactonase YvrE
MNPAIKILVTLTAVGSIAVLPPGKGFGAEALKFRHEASIYTDAKEIGLKRPEGVACSARSDLIVADTGNGRLLRYTFRDKTVGSEVREIKVPQLPYPVQVQLNSKGEIFVLDGRQRRIVRLTAAGRFSGYIDPPGMTAAVGQIPKRFHIDRNDNIYVLDIFAERVMVLDSGGQLIKSIRFPAGGGYFSNLTVDARGRILLLDSVNARVFATTVQAASFTPITENLKAYMRFPADLTTDLRGHIYLVDRNGGKIIILANDGSYLTRLSAMGWKGGLLRYPAQICLNASGEIFVADTNNDRVQIFSVIE